MISQIADDALRAIVYLGKHRGGPCTAAQISRATGAPISDLGDVMNGLSRAEVVDSHFGPHGDFTLTRDPSELSVLDVVTAVHGFQCVEHCPLGRLAQASGLCPLHRPIDNLIAASDRTGASASMGELLEEPNLPCTLPCISELAENAPLQQV